MAKHVIHKHSSQVVGGGAKLPQAEQIEYGEIALNYAKGYESISLKNNQDEIVTFGMNSVSELSGTFMSFSSSVVTELSEAGGGVGQVDSDSDGTGEIFNNYGRLMIL